MGVQPRAVRRLSRREGIQHGAVLGVFFAADLFIAEMGKLMSRKITRTAKLRHVCGL